MAETLDVLLIESDLGAGDADARRLEAAGHRVHRCYPVADPHLAPRVALRDRFLCAGVTEAACPLETGADVALLVRSRLATRPGWREAGVSCALRAAIPVVEDGPDLLDPYEPWLAGRADGDVVAACEAAAGEGLDALCREVVVRVDQLLRASRVEPAAVSCRLERAGSGLRVVFTGPALPTSTRQALSVRALDAVHAANRTFGQVDIAYEERTA